MYVILINSDNTMTTTQKANIMQRSKLVDELNFLVQPVYNDLNILNCTALLEYVLPISRQYSTDTLVADAEDYKGYIRYTLPVDTELTKEFGEIELSITFLYVGIDENGDIVQRVRKTFPTTIEVHRSASWSDVVPDSALSAIDQRIIKTDAQIKALQDMSTILNITKADNMRINETTSELTLLAGDIEIGDKIKLQTSIVDEETIEKIVGDVVDDAVKDSIGDGFPVVDFGGSEGTDDGDFETDETPGTADKEGKDNVVDF